MCTTSRRTESSAAAFLVETLALPAATVGALVRIRAALEVFGDGSTLRADPVAWVVLAGADDVPQLAHALEQLEARGILDVQDEAGEWAIAESRLAGPPPPPEFRQPRARKGPTMSTRAQK